MKIFMMIMGSILAITALVVFWLYSSFKFQPDYFDTIEKVDLREIQIEGQQAETRIRTALKDKGEVKVGGDELSAIVISQISKKKEINLKPILKKLIAKL